MNIPELHEPELGAGVHFNVEDNGVLPDGGTDMDMGNMPGMPGMAGMAGMTM